MLPEHFVFPILLFLLYLSPVELNCELKFYFLQIFWLLQHPFYLMYRLDKMEIPNYDSGDNPDKEYKMSYFLTCHQTHFGC